MIKTRWIRFALLLSLGLCANVHAKYYKWVDEKGTTHYSETIPPEYANRDSVQLNSKGRVEQRRDVETTAERQANDAANLKKQADELALRESRRRDSALLNTYTNEKEIDLAMIRSLQQVEARFNSFTTMLKSAQQTRAGLLKEQENLTQKGSKVPQALLDEIKENAARIAKIEKDLAQNAQELASVKSKFEADKQRFRELSGN